MFSRTPVVTLGGSVRALRLKLWDEGRRRLVSYPATGAAPLAWLRP
jgi:hypothetical protein